jgi:hypothetical protein
LNLVRDASDTREGVSRTIHWGTLGVPRRGFAALLGTPFN